MRKFLTTFNVWFFVSSHMANKLIFIFVPATAEVRTYYSYTPLKFTIHKKIVIRCSSYAHL